MVEEHRKRIRESAGSVKDESEKSRSGGKVEGAVHKAKGRPKEATGDLTGVDTSQVEGISDQRKGDAKKKKGHLRDLLE